MTDPQHPADQPAAAPTPPPAYNPPQPAYASAPPAAPGAPAPGAPVPGRTMGIVAFILSFFFALIALILGIIALVQSKKAGASNGWAVAAIIISSVAIVIGIILTIVLLSLGAAGLSIFNDVCAELGSGTHVLEGGTTITCP